jgi:hypothetical protein
MKMAVYKTLWASSWLEADASGEFVPQLDVLVDLKTMFVDYKHPPRLSDER